MYIYQSTYPPFQTFHEMRYVGFWLDINSYQQLSKRQVDDAAEIFTKYFKSKLKSFDVDDDSIGNSTMLIHYSKIEVRAEPAFSLIVEFR